MLKRRINFDDFLPSLNGSSTESDSDFESYTTTSTLAEIIQETNRKINRSLFSTIEIVQDNRNKPSLYCQNETSVLEITENNNNFEPDSEMVKMIHESRQEKIVLRKSRASENLLKKSRSNCSRKIKKKASGTILKKSRKSQIKKSSELMSEHYFE